MPEPNELTGVKSQRRKQLTRCIPLIFGNWHFFKKLNVVKLWKIPISVYLWYVPSVSACHVYKAVCEWWVVCILLDCHSTMSSFNSPPMFINVFLIYMSVFQFKGIYIYIYSCMTSGAISVFTLAPLSVGNPECYRYVFFDVTGTHVKLPVTQIILSNNLQHSKCW